MLRVMMALIAALTLSGPLTRTDALTVVNARACTECARKTAGTCVLSGRRSGMAVVEQHTKSWQQGRAAGGHISAIVAGGRASQVGLEDPEKAETGHEKRTRRARCGHTRRRPRGSRTATCPTVQGWSAHCRAAAAIQGAPHPPEAPRCSRRPQDCCPVEAAGLHGCWRSRTCVVCMAVARARCGTVLQLMRQACARNPGRQRVGACTESADAQSACTVSMAGAHERRRWRAPCRQAHCGSAVQRRVCRAAHRQGAHAPPAPAASRRCAAAGPQACA
jgi:hypothetical protein